MGCCLSKQKKSKPKAEPTVPTVEVPQAKPESLPQYAKMWMEHEPSDDKIKDQSIEHVEASPPPPPPSKRRQLLKDLFKEAKEKQERQEKQQKQLEKRVRSPLFKIHKMETMESASSALADQKGKSHMGIEQAIRQMVRENKQQLTCCSLCTETYTAQRPPMMLCMNQHTFCSVCISDLWKKGYQRCPMDQNLYDIANIQKNRFILSILEQMK